MSDIRITRFDLLRVHLAGVGPVRALTSFELATDAGPSNLVMIMGANGSGKTSVLEGIFAAMAALSARTHASFGMDALDAGDGSVQLDTRVTTVTPSGSTTLVFSITLGSDAPLRTYSDIGLDVAQAEDQATLLFGRARDGTVALLPASDPEAVGILDSLIEAVGTPALTLFGQELELPTLIYFPTSRGIARASAGVRGVAQPPNLTYRTAIRLGTDGGDWATSIDNLFAWYTWLEDDRGTLCRDLVNELVFKGRSKRIGDVDRQNLHTMVETEDGKHRIDQLSHGERQLLQFVVRIASHMTRSTIVMIDEAELHLHLVLRRRLMGLMKQWAKDFPGLTFILTSHQTDMLRVFLPKLEEEGLRKGGVRDEGRGARLPMSVTPAGFDEFETQADIERQQRGLIEVFLEGMNDVDLFKKFWFIDYLDRLDFKRSANGDGCEAVIAAVRSARAKGGLPAYGIVDRDVWRKRRDFRTLLELDDEAFKSRLIEDGVRVTLYWEIEAYLLEPDALVAWAALNWPKAPMEPCSEAEMVDTFAQVCACVLELTALNALRHKMSIREIPLFEVATEDHGQVRLKAEEHMAALAGDAAWHPSHEQTFRELMELTDTIRTERQGRTGMEAVRLMLRFCDTKVVFKRLANAFKIDDDRPWQLAQAMKYRNRRPEELSSIVADIARQHVVS